MKIFPSQLNPEFSALSFKGSVNVKVFFKMDDPKETYQLFNEKLPKPSFYKKIFLNLKSYLSHIFKQKNKHLNYNESNLFYYSSGLWSETKTQEKLIKQCKKIINKGFDINQINKEGNTNFHYACQIFNYPLIELLLSSQAQTDIKNYQNKTPLMLLLDNYEASIFSINFWAKDKMKAIKQLIEQHGFNSIYNKNTHFYFCKLLDILVSEHVTQKDNHEVLIHTMLDFIINYESTEHIHTILIEQYNKIDKTFNEQMELHPDVLEHLNIYYEKMLLDSTFQKNEKVALNNQVKLKI